jgi:hypothetical protein
MIKYETEYKETSNRKDFVNLVVKRKLTSEANAKKRYSGLKKKFGEQKKYNKRKVVISKIERKPILKKKVSVKKPVVNSSSAFFQALNSSMIKYEKEYKETSNRKDFVNLVVKRKLTSEANAKKRYSGLKKKFGEQKKVVINYKTKSVPVNKKQSTLRVKTRQKETVKAFTIDNEGFLFVDLTNNESLKGVRVKFKRTEGRKLRTVGLEIKR